MRGRGEEGKREEAKRRRGRESRMRGCGVVEEMASQGDEGKRGRGEEGMTGWGGVRLLV
jgi:hypothetical protein